MEDSIATTASTQERAPGGLAVYNEDEENLPPLKFEPGVVGAAQKGVSAVVIAFGACAFGACFWGVSQALFPSATSTQVIFSEALDKARHRPTTGASGKARRLGSRAHALPLCPTVDGLVDKDTAADHEDDEDDGQGAHASGAHLLDRGAHLRNRIGTGVKLCKRHAYCAHHTRPTVTGAPWVTLTRASAKAA